MRTVSSLAQLYRHSGMAVNLFMLRIISRRCFKSEKLAGNSDSRLLLKSRNWSKAPRPIKLGIPEILLFEMFISYSNSIILQKNLLFV